jgi:hypothetical protein
MDTPFRAQPGCRGRTLAAAAAAPFVALPPAPESSDGCTAGQGCRALGRARMRRARRHHPARDATGATLRHRGAAAALTPCYPAGSSGRGARLARKLRRDSPDGTATGKPGGCCCCLLGFGTLSPRLPVPGWPLGPRLLGSVSGGAREPRSLRRSAGPRAVRRAARLLRRARHTRALWRRARNAPPTCDGGATCRVGRGGVRCRRGRPTQPHTGLHLPPQPVDGLSLPAAGSADTPGSGSCYSGCRRWRRGSPPVEVPGVLAAIGPADLLLPVRALQRSLRPVMHSYMPRPVVPHIRHTHRQAVAPPLRPAPRRPRPLGSI